MRSFPKCLLWLLLGVLAAVLVWGFFLLTLQSRLLLSGIIVLMEIGGYAYLVRQSRSVVGQLATGRAPVLAPEGFTGVLILVCGDTAQLAKGNATGAVVQLSEREWHAAGLVYSCRGRSRRDGS